MKYTTEFKVAVEVEVNDTVYDEAIFHHHLQEEIARTVGYALDDESKSWESDTIVCCGEPHEAFLDCWERPYANVIIKVSVLAYSLDKVEE